MSITNKKAEGGRRKGMSKGGRKGMSKGGREGGKSKKRKTDLR